MDTYILLIRNYILICSLVFCGQSFGWFFGTIKFDSKPKNIDPVAIYYEGNKIVPTIQSKKGTISFEVPRNTGQTLVHLLISEYTLPVSCTTHQGIIIPNTYSHFEVPPQMPYKLYRLQLIPNTQKSIKGRDSEYCWKIQQIFFRRLTHYPSSVNSHYLSSRISHFIRRRFSA